MSLVFKSNKLFSSIVRGFGRLKHGLKRRSEYKIIVTRFCVDRELFRKDLVNLFAYANIFVACIRVTWCLGAKSGSEIISTAPLLNYHYSPSC